MSMNEHVVEKDYSDGRTKQSFKNSTDIQKILAKAQKIGSLSHLAKFEGQYGDFESFDYHEAQTMLANGNSIFSALPAELRKEFGQDPGKFFEFVNNPENVGKLGTIFPELAKPGRQMPRASDEPPLEVGQTTIEPPVVAETGEEPE